MKKVRPNIAYWTKYSCDQCNQCG